MKDELRVLIQQRKHIIIMVNGDCSIIKFDNSFNVFKYAIH